MKIATWNVNSIRARQARVLGWLDQHRPDVLCMQETKVTDDEFPLAELAELGYRCAVCGQRSYNGVAILARAPIEDVTRGLDDGGDDSEARAVAGTVEGVRVMSVYVPNGREVGHPKYELKLEWLARLRAYLERRHAPSQPLVVCGDFNVALDDRDVYDPDAWRDRNLFSEPEKQAVRRLLDWGLVDAFRHHHPEPGFYTWWDYRLLGFAKNRGLRIDHLFVTRPLLERSTGAFIDRNARKGKSPSDHAPVVLELETR